MELTETRIDGETVYQGVVFTITQDRVLLPNGHTGRRDLVHSHGGAVILPVDGEGCVTLVHQYRYAHSRVMLEAVAGKLEAGEEPFPAAVRELREETGFTAGRWDALGYIATSPGFLTEKLYLYLARELQAGAQALDPDEFLNVERLPLEEAWEMCCDGRISDGKTLAILARARQLLEREG